MQLALQPPDGWPRLPLRCGRFGRDGSQCWRRLEVVVPCGCADPPDHVNTCWGDSSGERVPKPEITRAFAEPPGAQRDKFQQLHTLAGVLCAAPKRFRLRCKCGADYTMKVETLTRAYASAVEHRRREIVADLI